MRVIKMTDLNLSGKRVLIREDLNVPVKDGKITSTARLRASLSNIQFALKAGAKVIVLSHLGRPAEGTFSAEDSLAPVAKELSAMLGQNVPLITDYLNGVDVAQGQAVLCENVRFNKGEKKNDPELGKAYAALCDIFVMDAFATAHRAEASTVAVAEYAPLACAGMLLAEELTALTRALGAAEHPLIAVIGGSKVSTKLTVLDSLSKKVDKLIVGGGIANNFIKAAGFEVGKSLYEPDLVEEAARLMKAAKDAGGEIPVPVDVVVSKALSETSSAVVKKVSEVARDDMILDIGPKTAVQYAAMLKAAESIVWNGPVGAFEIDQFGKGTEAVCKAVAESGAFSIAGGGDTVAAIEKYGATSGISYMSTAGGAFLEFLEGKTLPAVAVLERRAARL